jgi:DNA-binding response OmpR family regulator
MDAGVTGGCCGGFVMAHTLGTVEDRHILLVEDETTIAEAVAARLQAERFTVEIAADGPAAVECFDARRPDLIVLDLMLPGFDGLEVCRRVQAVYPVPVLMLTARNDESDLLVGLGIGADDYLTKPFSMRELVARIRALLRRVDQDMAVARAQAGPTGQRIALGPLRLDHAARRVHLEGTEVHLTPTEFDLLKAMADQPGTVFTRGELLRLVWGWPDAAQTRAVDSQIKALRRKLGSGLIRTVHGVGYAIEIPR